MMAAAAARGAAVQAADAAGLRSSSMQEELQGRHRQQTWRCLTLTGLHSGADDVVNLFSLL